MSEVIQIRSCDTTEWSINAGNSDALCFPGERYDRNVPCICKLCPYDKSMFAPKGKRRGIDVKTGKVSPDPEGIFRTDDHLPWNHYDKLQELETFFEDNVKQVIIVDDESDHEIEEEFWIR